MKLNEYLKSVFSRPKVQKQLVTIFIIVLLVPVIVCFFLLYQTNRTLNARYLEQTESDNLRVKSIMFDTTTNIYQVSSNLASDQELLALLCRDYEDNSEAVTAIDQYKNIFNIMYMDTSISSVNVYTFNESIGDYSYFHTVTDEIRETPWFEKASETPSPFWMSSCRTDTRQNVYWELTLYRKIPLARIGSYAVISVDVSDNYLKNRIDNTTQDAVLSVNSNPVFYSSQKAYLGKALPTEIDYDSAMFNEAGIFDMDGQKAVVSVSTLIPLNTDDRLYIVSYDKDALGSIHDITRNYVLIILATILLPVIIFYIYSVYFSGRILMLRRAMHQASQGNYDIMDSFTGNDEISETFHDLRTMIGEIQEKEAEIYQARIREQEIINRQQQMEFKMLASQINPHFLYNTLETIRMKAFTAGNREVATAIKLLGKSLRYVLENTGTVSIPLSKELDYIHTYISIQRLRFGDRINLEEKIQEDLDITEYRILPLLLQPIVENSISHGLEGVETGGCISLEIFEQGNDLHIRISDNGKGMTPEELQKLRQRIATRDETRTRSIGLSNINYRLLLCYGKKYPLQMESTAGCGTVTTIRIPLNKIKEVPSDEGSYRG